jgi:glycolate oxidase
MNSALTELRALLGSRLLTRDAELAPYASDALTAYHRRPLAVALPETQDEVTEIVRILHRHQTPFVARGSGTSLSGGSLPVPGGVVLALNRLNRILRLDPEARLAVVEPGVINLEISRQAAPYGLYYAPDPSSQPISTIGGNLAFNAGGAHCLKYGMTSNHVLAVKAVLATGEVVELGSESAEGIGPDWLGLWVGSEGLFGVTLEATVRLLPKPERYHTVLASYASLREAGEAVAAVIAEGLLPGAMEIMDRLAIEAVEAAVAPGYPKGAEAILIVELEGEAPQVAAEARRLEEVLRRSGAQTLVVAANEQERGRIWRGRKSAFAAVGYLSPDYLVNDGVVPRSRLGEALEEIQKLSQRFQLRVANVFHAGDGNLHPLILYDGRQPGAREQAEALAGEILKLCIALGGSITGEHGVGVEKRAYLPSMFSPDDLEVMARIREQMDPLGLANPGKMFPEELHVPAHA